MSERIYAVEFTGPAREQLARLDRSVQLRILKAAGLLSKHPRPPAARRLSSSSELWRIRIGDYRVTYSILEDRIVIAIARAGHRSSVYRNLDEL